MVKRYNVHERFQSPVGRRIREPFLVIDRDTNAVVDEYRSKRAAQWHANQLNDMDRIERRNERDIYGNEE